MKRLRRSKDRKKSTIKRKICQKYNASTVEKYGHYKNHCPELKKRKETNEASVAEEKEPSKKAKQDKTDFFL